MNKQEFVSELSKLRTSAMFLTLLGYQNSNNEIADYNIIFHIDYKSALSKSVKILEGLNLNSPLEVLARSELLSSYNKSIEKIQSQSIDEIDDAYQRFFNENGSYIKGVKLHRETNCLHLYGLIAHKRIRIPGTYQKVDRKELTITKNKLAKLCPVSKFRQFIIQPFQVEKINVQHLSLLPPTE